MESFICYFQHTKLLLNKLTITISRSSNIGGEVVCFFSSHGEKTLTTIGLKTMGLSLVSAFRLVALI